MEGSGGSTNLGTLGVGEVLHQEEGPLASNSPPPCGGREGGYHLWWDEFLLETGVTFKLLG